MSTLATHRRLPPSQRVSSSTSVPRGRCRRSPGEPWVDGVLAAPCGSRSSMSQSPAGSEDEKWISSPSRERTAAGRVRDVLITTRSPGSRKSASRAKQADVVAAVPSELGGFGGLEARGELEVEAVDAENAHAGTNRFAA